MRGHVKVTKIYDDHEEVVVNDHNILTEGFKIDIVSILTGEAVKLPDLVPGYIQIGTDTVDYNLQSDDVSGLFYQVCAPLTNANYGDETELYLEELYRSFMASTNDSGATYSEMLFASSPASSTVVSATPDREWFGVVQSNYRTKFFLDNIEVRLELDKKTANGVAITEFGLFNKNPHNYKEDRPFLMAYKKIGTAITKRPEFKLLVEWSIGFPGNTNSFDFVFPEIR